MTKRIVAVLVVLLLAGTIALVAGCGEAYVARVGNGVITQPEFDQRLADFEAQYAGQIPDKSSDPGNYKLFQQDVLEYMITYELATQYAQEKKITVTEEDIQKEIDSIRDQSFGGDQVKFDEALKEQGITLELLKRSYSESMLLQKVYDDVTKDVTTVPDADIQAYYDANKADYFVDESRTARHILIAPDPTRVDGTTSTTTSSTTSTTVASTASSAGSTDSSATPSTTGAGSTPTASSSTTTTAAPTEADWNAALETANDVRAQLVAGADWTEMAKKYSDDPGSKEKGGDLGTVSKGEMVQEFEDSVFSLKKDEISQPVKSAYGYHIIQVTEITPAKQYTLEEVKEEISSSLVSEKKTETWRNWIDQRKSAARVTYADDWKPTTTTTSTAWPTETTSGPADTTTTSAGSGSTATTGASGSTNTTAGATITTAAPTTTTAKP